MIDETGAVRSDGRASMADFGTDPRDPLTWLAAVESALGAALVGVARSRVAALAVDGTSGTLVPVNVEGEPLARGRMYDDTCEDSALLSAIDVAAPAESAARGPTSGLARAALFLKLRRESNWAGRQRPDLAPLPIDRQRGRHFDDPKRSAGLTIRLEFAAAAGGARLE